jgi:diguanylate cyclase (GGDEF)-like protein
MQQHPLTRLSRRAQRGEGPLARLLQQVALSPVYQPIAVLASGAVFAHEALIRGPQGSSMHAPAALLKAAAQEQLDFEFESVSALAAIYQTGVLRDPGRLFVNISARVLVQLLRSCGRDALLDLVHALGVLPRMLVLEITEHERVADMDRLARAVEVIRTAGVSLALDDFGDGRSSLRLWSQIKPEFVKIDKYFTKDISFHADKLKTIQALQQIATTFQTELIAEGIETLDDLRVLRDLGIPYGQGYVLGRPVPDPVLAIAQEATELLQDRRVSVFPELVRAPQRGHLRPMALLNAPYAGIATSNDELAAIFLREKHLHAIAVVDAQRPVAIINRSQFMNDYSKLYFREIWGRKSCMMHANDRPRLIERDHNVDELIGILTSEDQRYLADGFIVTENGRYAGLATADQLVRSVTETRIEAARHANPLTFLPGNVPISQHIERLLASGGAFVACYADLNHFKPFNDQYGYWRGDEMIRLLAGIVLSHCDTQRDFVGHVGGDDFIMLFQSRDWRQRCEAIVAELAARARQMFDDTARARGGIEAEDRHGVLRFFPCTTLSIGAVIVRSDAVLRAEDVATRAALAKHHAKSDPNGLCVLDATQHAQPVAAAARVLA